MERSVQEHEAFLPGLDLFGQYSQDCLDKTKTCDTKHFITLIDSFAPLLTAHMKNEIETLLGLSKYDLKALKKAYLILAAEAQKADKVRLCPLCAKISAH